MVCNVELVINSFDQRKLHSVAQTIYTMKVALKFVSKVLCLIVVFLTPTQGQDMVGGREVSVYLHPKNFYTAFETCRALDMDLLMIHNLMEELQMVELTTKYNISGVWLAATDLGHESLFVSLTTGKGLEYSNWFPSEPDNANGREHCVIFVKEYKQITDSVRGGWNDFDCLSAKPFFCEMPVSIKVPRWVQIILVESDWMSFD